MKPANALTAASTPEAHEARSGLLSSLARAVATGLKPLFLPLEIAYLKRRIASSRSLSDDLETAWSFPFARVGMSIRPWQLRSEIERLLRIVRDRRPRTIVEIGTSMGGTLFLFARCAAPDALLVSVDLPQGAFGGGYPRWKAPFYRAFAGRDQRIELVRADSHDAATLEELRVLLGGREVDLLFIDGDHSYEGVKRDFEMYEPLVADGGIVAFHDIVPAKDLSPLLQSGEVSHFWREVRAGREHEELVEDWEGGAFGIGVLHVRRAG